MSVERAAREDLPEILALLGTNGLPPDGLEGHLGSTLVAREAGRVVGSAALELYGPYTLLRSVAVERRHRGGGLGQHLTREAFLLTADGFVPRFGFEPVVRPAVPEDVRGSVEFVAACPESARVMSADLRGLR